MVDNLFEYEIFSIGTYALTVLLVFKIMMLVLFSWIITLVSRRVIQRQINSSKFDTGRGHAFYQIVKYIVIVVALITAMDILGIKLNLLLAGSAALLVGVGLGLQQIFNDIVSGILLLFEGTVSIGDIVEVNNIVGKVKKISLRTSNIETRDSIVIIVPNSRLVSDNVINWSHKRTETRFNIKVGVAYGSDVKLVLKILQEAAEENPDVVSKNRTSARLVDFGESSLDFELLFYTNKMFEIEFVRSQIRVAIDEKFRQQGITIPFPQRDLHLKTAIPISHKNQE